MRAAFFAAWRRTRGPFVRAAFCAEARRDRSERRDAARLACFDNARVEVVRLLSRFNARFVARERVADGRVPLRPARVAAFAARFVEALALRGGAPTLTPARLAFDRPIAIACFADRAPCFPSRT
ncbi:MAG TPA: hypothetical protein VEA16_05285 [Vicinamibacterales bacterium]|nr:hypothetical protein [Vicinamibacterales bacterium]